MNRVQKDRGNRQDGLASMVQAGPSSVVRFDSHCGSQEGHMRPTTDPPKAVKLSGDSVFVLSADAGDRDRICRCVEEGGYHTQHFTTLAGLEAGLISSQCMATILDIDSVPLDNRTIRQLTLSFPAVCFLCASREHLHPELKDAICYHLFACMNKPLDSDELHYFLKSIQNNESDLRGLPER